MAAIAAGNVSYTFLQQKKAADAERLNLIQVGFGNGTLTYPSGGIPLTGASMGLPNYVRSVDLVDPSNSDGYVYKWSQSANTIRIYQSGVESASALPLAEIATSVAPAATTLVVSAQGW